MVPLDFPAFDCRHVQGEAPDGSAEEEDQGEEDEGVGEDEDEEVRELEGGGAEVLWLWNEFCGGGCGRVGGLVRVLHLGGCGFATARRSGRRESTRGGTWRQRRRRGSA